MRLTVVLKKVIKLLMIVALFYAAARFIVVFRDSRLTGERAPYIQMLSQSSVYVRWLTKDHHVGILRFGEDPDHMPTVYVEPSSVTNHSVELTGLKPATRYYYQVGEIGHYHDFDAGKHWFYTAPQDSPATRIWVIGDSGQAGEIQQQVRDAAFEWMQKNPLLDSRKAEVIDKPMVDVWLALGDLAYRSGSNKQFQAGLFEPYEDLLSNTSLWPVYGNHDDRRWTYFRIFDLPEDAEAGGLASNTENYYAFNRSNIHFIVLDSQASNRAADADMADWLKQDLAENTKPWVVVAFHHPPYTKGSHDSDNASDSRGRMQDMRKNILPILERAGVDLVLSGHSHMYERSYLLDCAYGSSEAFSISNIVSTGVDNKNINYIKPMQAKSHQGTIYMVAGSSAKVDGGRLDHPAHYLGLMEAGSVVIDVVANRLSVRFINNKGQVRDKFSISKQAGFKSGYKGCSSDIGSLQ